MPRFPSQHCKTKQNSKRNKKRKSQLAGYQSWENSSNKAGGMGIRVKEEKTTAKAAGSSFCLPDPCGANNKQGLERVQDSVLGKFSMDTSQAILTTICPLFLPDSTSEAPDGWKKAQGFCEGVTYRKQITYKCRLQQTTRYMHTSPCPAPSQSLPDQEAP